MVLYTRCIFDFHPDDGCRISIMSRHTYEDGKTPDPRITPQHYDIHWPELGPPARLVGAYYNRGLPWDEFESKFCGYLLRRRDRLHEIIDHALHEPVTLLCIEPTPERCHRRLVAEECNRIEPELDILIS